MDVNLFDWLKDDIKEVKQTLKDLSDKVDRIEQFRWQILGGAAVISVIVGFLFNVVMLIVGSK